MEALAFQTFELLNSMEKDSNVKLESLCVDGGVTRSDTLMNTIAGFLGKVVEKFVLLISEGF